MKKILSFLVAIALFIPVVRADNSAPNVKSTISKDGTLDFSVSLTDIELDLSVDYEWGISSSASTDVADWFDLEGFTANSAEVTLDFQDAKFRNVMALGDTVYLTVREKSSQTERISDAAVDVTIPYAYGLIPQKIMQGMCVNENCWTVVFPRSESGTYSNAQQAFAAQKITDEKIISDYLAIKGSSDFDSKLKDLISNLNLTGSDVPENFRVDNNSIYHVYDEDLGIRAKDKSLFFIWSWVADTTGVEGAKPLFAVTIYDHNYEPSNSNQGQSSNVTKNDEPVASKGTSDTTKNPKTGVSIYAVSGATLIILTLIIYVSYRKKVM